MPNRTDIRSLKHAFALGALSLALYLPAASQAQAPTPATVAPAASLMDLPSSDTTPPTAAPLPDATSPAMPSSAPAPAALPSLPAAADPSDPAITPAPAAPLPQAAPLPSPVASPVAAPVPAPAAPLKEIPSTPLTPASPVTPVAAPAPAGEPANTQEPAKEVTRTVEIIPPKIISVSGTTPPIELLEHPMKLDKGLSLMFTEKDMFSLVLPSLELYDKAEDPNNKTASNTQATDDLTGLLESLKLKGEDKVQEAPQVLPNIYLGSIMYYSPSNWSIWLNGKKVTNAVNGPDKPLYVEAIDRTHVRLVWKPTSMTALNKVLNKRKIATPEVLDIEGSRVTVTMRPNQTFVASLLAVLEGMVRQTAVPEPAPGNAAEPAPAAATAPAPAPAMPANGKFMDKRKR